MTIMKNNYIEDFDISENDLQTSNQFDNEIMLV